MSPDHPRGRMKSVLRVALIIVVAYLSCWTVIYAAIMEFDFRYFLEYLMLSWVGPGEIPGLIQLYSLIALSILVCVFGLTKAILKVMSSRTNP